MEGGSICVDGRGRLVTTEQCLLNPNRNPHLSQVDIEQCLREYLGVQEIVWFGNGLLGDREQRLLQRQARTYQRRQLPREERQIRG